MKTKKSIEQQKEQVYRIMYNLIPKIRNKDFKSSLKYRKIYNGLQKKLNEM